MKAKPLSEVSRKVAEAIYDNKAEIDVLAWEQGNLHQDDKAERFEWCRLVSMLIEKKMVEFSDD